MRQIQGPTRTDTKLRSKSCYPRRAEHLAKIVPAPLGREGVAEPVEDEAGVEEDDNEEAE